MDVKKISSSEFEKFLYKHPLNTFRQSVEWATYKEKQGNIIFYIGIFCRNNLIGASLIVGKKTFFGKYIYYAPRGYLIDYKNFSDLCEINKEIINFLKNEKGIIIKIDPYIINKERDKDGNAISEQINKDVIDNLKKIGYIHQGFDINKKYSDSRFLSILDIKDKTIEEIHGGMDSRCKKNLKKTEDYEYIIENVNDKNMERFINIMDHLNKRREINVTPAKDYYDLYDIYKNKGFFYLCLLDVDNSIKKMESLYKLEEEKLNEINSHNSTGDKKQQKILEQQARIDKTKNRIDELNNFKKKKGSKIDLGCAFFIDYADEYIYLMGGSYEEYMEYNAQYILQWEMIKKGIENKKAKHNFLGISANFDPNGKRYGVFAFKRGFGASVVELIGEFHYIINPFYYAVYRFFDAIKRRILIVCKK